MTPADIIIVDDNPANLKLLENMLSQKGHEIHSFPLGRLALAAALRHPPDLMLLDINMPEMNGYEVCQRLKANQQTAGVPVIFMSALTETADKVKAFQAGGADYISKPFQFEEVHARVAAHLSEYRLRHGLEQAVAARTRELAEANKRLDILDQSKNEFLRLISHEFRTPLNGVLGVGELVLMGSQDTALRQMFDQSRQRILTILEDAMLLTHIDVDGDQFSRRPALLRTVLQRAQQRVADFADGREVRLETAPMNGDLVMADEELLEKAFSSLLETAVKFSARGQVVKIAYDDSELVFETSGKTIHESLLPKFFDLFALGESSTPAGDIGLGPAVACRILALFGGTTKIENRMPCGIRLTIGMALAKN